MIQVQQPIVRPRQQDLGPLALDAGRPRDEKAVRGQVLREHVAALCDLVVGETVQRARVASQLVGGLLHAEIADRIARAGQQQTPVRTEARGRGHADAAKQLLASKALGKHVD